MGSEEASAAESSDAPQASRVPPSPDELRTIAILRELDERQLQRLIDLSEVITLEANEALITDGDEAHDFFFVLRGTLVVHLRDEETDRDYPLSSVGPGEPIGEMQLFDPGERSATVRAEQTASVVRVPVAEFEELILADRAFARIELALGRQLVRRMRALSDVTATALGRVRLALRQQQQSSATFVGVIAVLCLFAFSMNVLRALRDEAPAQFLVTSLILLPITAILLIQLRSSQVPLASVGVNLVDWKRSLKESLAWTGGFVVLLIAFKASVLALHPAFDNTPLFDPLGLEDERGPLWGSSWLSWAVEMGVYVIECPLQEFVARGVLQSRIEHLLTIRRRRAVAIVLSSVIFGTMHLYAEPVNAVAVIIPGLFWGWMFARQRTLLGVTISHIVIGVTTFFLLGGLQTYPDP